MKPDPKGLPAVTEWKVMGRGDGLTWLALEPVTGRTHQLRVHCAEMGWPIVGDTIYGTSQARIRSLRKEGPRSGGPALHLHSREIVVPISKNKEPVRVTAPVPEHMRERLAACGWRGEDQPGPQ
jgi:tRNA pseudouridine32 synthase/23S rRNA pseudouridine746 synthase